MENYYILDLGQLKILYAQHSEEKTLSQLNIPTEFPSEHFIELKGLSPYLSGRLTINKTDIGYDTDVDIVLSESGKIYKHITVLYNSSDFREALDLGYHALKKHLKSLKKM
jgi:hypothetical protein